MKRLPCLVLTVIVLSTVVGQGQYWNYGGGHASTAAEGYANGLGNVVRSQGIYNQLTAQAAISAEQARQLQLDNKLKATQTFFEMRRMNREYTAAERGDNRTNKYTSPPPRRRLSVSQLDPVTGQITWMPVLMDQAFAPYRDELQSLFTLRAQHQGGDVTFTQVRRVTDAMNAELKKQINYLQPQDYINARRFIDTLADESRLAGVESAGSVVNPPAG